MPRKDWILLCGGWHIRERPDPAMWWKGMPGKDRILLCGGRQRRVTVMFTGCPCGQEGNCIWKCRAGQLKVNITASHDRHRMSAWSERHCSKKKSFEWIIWPDEIGHSTAGFIGLTVDNTSDVFPASRIHWSQYTSK